MAKASRNGSSSQMAGFTLLEILVVVVVMALLMGIAFKLVAPATNAGSISGVVKQLNLLKAAIEEYHAEYGIYPPAADRVFGGNYDSSGLKEVCGSEPPGASMGYAMPLSTSLKLNRPNVFSFGLLSFLVDRLNPTNPGEYGQDADPRSPLWSLYKGASAEEILGDFGGDSHWGKNGKGLKKATPLSGLLKALAPADRDAHFFKRVYPYIDEARRTTDALDLNGERHPNHPEADYHYYSIHDSWGRDFVYICPPPHTSFALFSVGPDGACVASDPLNRDAKCPKCGKFHNRDNVYAAVGDK